MGLGERLQSVTQFFQKAATRGHQLREDEERGDNDASSPGEQALQGEDRRQGGMTAENGDSEQAGQQRN